MSKTGGVSLWRHYWWGEAHKVLNGYRGIEVGQIAPAFPVECDGKERELDGVCFGADMVVIIEAKSRLREGHIGQVHRQCVTTLHRDDASFSRQEDLWCGWLSQC